MPTSPRPATRIGACERERLRDRAAHRMADDHGALERERVEQTGDGAGIGVDRMRGPVRPTCCGRGDRRRPRAPCPAARVPGSTK